MPVTLVTGSTGLLGNNLVRMLLEAGQTVRVLVRPQSNQRALAGLDLQFAWGDVRDEASVHRAMAGTSCVIHAAGYVRVGWADPKLYQSINVQGTKNMGAAARSARARMVHVSSCDVLRPAGPKQPIDEQTARVSTLRVPYARTKRLAEQSVADQIEQGLDAIIVNPAYMLGPWDWKPSSGQMLLAVARGRALLAPRGFCSLCDVRDVARAILIALQRWRPGCRYILAGQTMSYLEMWQAFAEVTGGRRPLCRAGPLMSWIGGMLGDSLGRATGYELPINSASFLLANLPREYSSRRAQRELDYHNRPIDQTIRDAWVWFQQHGYAPESRLS